MQSLAQVVGKQSKGSRHIFALHQNIRGDGKVGGGKIPDGQNPRRNQFVANGLGGASGHGDYPNVDVHAAANIAELAHGKYGLSAYLAIKQKYFDQYQKSLSESEK